MPKRQVCDHSLGNCGKATLLRSWRSTLLPGTLPVVHPTSTAVSRHLLLHSGCAGQLLDARLCFLVGHCSDHSSLVPTPTTAVTTRRALAGDRVVAAVATHESTATPVGLNPVLRGRAGCDGLLLRGHST